MSAAEDVYTVAELQALSGRKQRAAVIRVLKQNDCPFMIDADGWPRVHRSWVPGVVSLKPRRTSEPDLDALAS